jgi:hypothetical protein
MVYVWLVGVALGVAAGGAVLTDLPLRGRCPSAAADPQGWPVLPPPAGPNSSGVGFRA